MSFLLPKDKRFISWAIVYLGGFFLVFFFETQGFFLNIDANLTAFFQSFVPRALDVPLSVFSILGTFEITTITLAGIAYWIFRREKIILYSLVFFGVLLAVELVSKFLVIHPGPPLSLLRYNFPLKLPLVEVKTNYSFPSGHVSRTTFLAVLAIFLANKYLLKRAVKQWFSVGCLMFVALMVFSRVYLGEHWTSDVIGGVFLGGAMGLLALAYY